MMLYGIKQFNCVSHSYRQTFQLENKHQSVMRNDEQKSPQNIEKLLKIVNLEPPKDKSLNPAVLKKEQSKIDGLENYQGWVAITAERILKAANPDFRKYLLSEGEVELIVLEIYFDFFDYREKVLRVAKRAEFFQRDNRDPKFGDAAKISEMVDALVDPVVYPISLSVTKDGKLDFKSDLVANTLQGADATRLKFCKCKKVFWAHRKNTKYCSAKCSNFYRQKEFTSDERKRRKSNEQRRENYKNRKLRIVR